MFNNELLNDAEYNYCQADQAETMAVMHGLSILKGWDLDKIT